MIARDAPRALGQGAFISAWSDEALNEVRSRFVSDTTVTEAGVSESPRI